MDDDDVLDDDYDDDDDDVLHDDDDEKFDDNGGVVEPDIVSPARNKSIESCLCWSWRFPLLKYLS